MVVNITKVSQSIKKQKVIEERKKILKNEKKCTIIIIGNYYYKKNYDLESSFEVINLLQKANLDEKTKKIMH